MRDMVASLRSEDGTGRDLVGTDAYTSTRKLTVPQLRKLIARVEEGGKRERRRQAPAACQIDHLLSKGERDYVEFMRRALQWSKAALDDFAARQCKGKRLATHAQTTALITPMERLLKERGWVRSDLENGRKWWDPPPEGHQQAQEADRCP